MSALATVVPIGHARTARRAQARVSHPSLGACTDCGSERLKPMVRTGRTVPEAVRCECCGWILSIEEHARLRAAVEGVPTLGRDR